ncbi:MAG: sugar ABC transporter permease [Armatimonadetes bacterium]|nr:sugar ABC transporter permease [Armatimonadota bacterium]
MHDDQVRKEQPTIPSMAGGTRPRSKALRQWAAAYGFLLPNLVGFLVFTLVPVIAAMLLSFVRWDAISPWRQAQWVGLSNYVEILGFHRDPTTGALLPNDDRFWYYLYNTVYLMLGIPIGMALSLVTALLLNRPMRGVVLFRTVFFIPTVCSAVAVAVLWRWIYQPDYGLLNEALRLAGIENTPNWLGDPAWAKPALILMGLWVGVGGYNCVLYLAGLQNIPEEMYEAARLDGAGWWARLRHVTWPLLAPTTFFILVTSIISGFQGFFVSIHIMTAGGPAGSTTTLLYHIYQTAFVYHEMGRASALAMILFAIVLVLTLLNWRYGREAAQVMF